MLTGTAINVLRVAVRFASLPTADAPIAVANSGSNLAGVFFKQSDSKLYAGTLVAGVIALGATGVSITTDQWYVLDIKSNMTNNPWLVDVNVNGTSCGQRSTATASSTSGSLRLGDLDNARTVDMFFDDCIWSQTSGDFPIGGGNVYCFVPTSDGTHNIAGTGDFQRGNTAVDILNATTTAFQLIDDVPLPSGAVDEADNQRAVAPPNATDYPECIFGPASGVQLPIVEPRAVDVILAHHQISTATGQMVVELNDNGTVNTVFDTGAAAGVVTYRYARKQYATAPTGGAWNALASGPASFRNIRCRFRAPDAAPDQCLDGIMIEAEFAPQLDASEFERPFGQSGQAQMNQLLAQ